MAKHPENQRNGRANPTSLLVIIVLALLAFAGSVSAQTNTGRFNRLSVGSSPALPTVGTVRFQGLGSSGGSSVLLVDGSGNVIARVLAKADLPSAIAYEDEANTFSSTQTFTGAAWFRGAISESASGVDEVRLGVLSGTPRAIFEDAASGTLWQIDNSAGVLRVFSAAGGSGTERFRFVTDAFTPGFNQGYTKDLGTFLNKFRSIYGAELRVETLIAADVRSTIGGKFITAPTTELAADLASGATSISVKHNEIASGDRLWLEGNGQFEFMAATSGPSGSGPYSYTVTRNLDGSGANDWPAGSAVVNTGTTGNGFIEQYADEGLGGLIGPTIRGIVRTGTTYSDLDTRWAIGNLNGLFGYASEIYGAAFGDGAGTNVTVDATNGFRVRTGGTTTRFHADTSGNVSLTGDLIGTSWRIRNSDGINLVTGALSGGQSRQIWFSSSLGGTQLGTLYDDGTDVLLYRASNAVRLLANSGTASIQGGGGAAWRARIRTVADNANSAAYAELDGASLGYTLAFRPGTTDSFDLGTASLRWREIYWSEPTTGNALFPAVTDGGRLMAKNDGLNGATSCGAGQAVKTITFEFGIATAITCGAP